MIDSSTTDEPSRHTIESQGIALSYVDWGNSSAPTLLLIHGTRDHARSWDWTARALRDRWHVVALDLRGHGDSGWSPDGAYLLPYHVLDLAEVIDALGQQQVTIVAHSYGGSVAGRYAGLFPDRVRKIVIVDGLGPDPVNYALWEDEGAVARSRQWIEQRRKSTPTRRFPTIEQAAERMAAANPHLSPAVADHLARHGVRRHEDGYSWKFDPRVSMFTPEDFEVRGSQYWTLITAPVLILYGRKSWTTNPVEDGRAAFFQHARTLTFEDAGHWIHHDQFDGFIDAVTEFIDADAP